MVPVNHSGHFREVPCLRVAAVFALFLIPRTFATRKQTDMFDNLSDKLERAFKVLKGQGQITEINVAETTKEIRRALLDADVNFKTAKEFSDRLKERAIGENVLTTVSPGQLLTKLAHDELAQLMGGQSAGLNLSGNPTVVLMSGLQGSGKTTFTGKLANHLRKKGRKPLMVACVV